MDGPSRTVVDVQFGSTEYGTRCRRRAICEVGRVTWHLPTRCIQDKIVYLRAGPVSVLRQATVCMLDLVDKVRTTCVVDDHSRRCLLCRA
jgi:hypothetical protein